MVSPRLFCSKAALNVVLCLITCFALLTRSRGDSKAQGSKKMLVPEKVESLSGVVKISNSLYNIMAWTKKAKCTAEAAWRSAFTSPEFADITFVVNGEDIPAHRVILAKRSEYFRNMFSSGMKETYQDRVDINGVPADTFKNVLSFLYTDKVNVKLDSSILSLFEAANMYGLDNLKDLCRRMVDRNLSIDKLGPLLQGSSGNAGCQDIHNLCVAFATKHYDALPHGLKKHITNQSPAPIDDEERLAKNDDTPSI